MLRHISLRWLFAVVWLPAFGALSYELFSRSIQLGQPGRIDWLGAAIGAAGVAGLVVLIVQRLQEEPTKEELAALGAILQAGPGTIGAVVVTRNGVPEVLATIRSREEYLMLAGSGRLPPDHTLFLPEDA